MLAEVHSNSKIVSRDEHTLHNLVNPSHYNVNRQIIDSFKGVDENRGYTGVFKKYIYMGIILNV